MSGELEHWRGRLPESVEKRLERWQPLVLQARPEPREFLGRDCPLRGNVTRRREALPATLELFRYCAIFDGEMWLSRYIWRNGKYEFNTSVELTTRQQSRYSAEDMLALPDSFQPDVERCACCSTWTMDGAVGSVWCPSCSPRFKARVCYGRTSRSWLFQCRDSCGCTGRIASAEHPEVALVPGRRSYGNSIGCGYFGTTLQASAYRRR